MDGFLIAVDIAYSYAYVVCKRWFCDDDEAINAENA